MKYKVTFSNDENKYHVSTRTVFVETKDELNARKFVLRQFGREHTNILEVETVKEET